MVSRFADVFCGEFNLNRELVKKEIQKELFVMAERRGTLDEIANLPLSGLLENCIKNS